MARVGNQLGHGTHCGQLKMKAICNAITARGGRMSAKWKIEPAPGGARVWRTTLDSVVIRRANAS